MESRFLEPFDNSNQKPFIGFIELMLIPLGGWANRVSTMDSHNLLWITRICCRDFKKRVNGCFDCCYPIRFHDPKEIRALIGLKPCFYRVRNTRESLGELYCTIFSNYSPKWRGLFFGEGGGLFELFLVTDETKTFAVLLKHQA